MEGGGPGANGGARTRGNGQSEVREVGAGGGGRMKRAKRVGDEAGSEERSASIKIARVAASRGLPRGLSFSLSLALSLCVRFLLALNLGAALRMNFNAFFLFSYLIVEYAR